MTRRLQQLDTTTTAVPNAIVLIKDSSTGFLEDKQIKISDLFNGLVYSSRVKEAPIQGEIPQVINSTAFQPALPPLSAEFLTDLDLAIGDGNNSTAGLTKLSDSTTSTANVNAGFAATPLAVKTVNDLKPNKAAGQVETIGANWTFTGDQTFTNTIKTNLTGDIITDLNGARVIHTDVNTHVFGSHLKDTRIDGDTLDLNSSTLTTQGNTIWHSGNDVNGSGLNATTLQSVTLDKFGRRDLDNIWSGNQNNLGNIIINSASTTGREFIADSGANGQAVFRMSSNRTIIGNKDSGGDWTGYILIGQGNLQFNTGVAGGGGTYEVFHANNSNKSNVNWQSNFSEMQQLQVNNTSHLVGDTLIGNTQGLTNTGLDTLVVERGVYSNSPTGSVSYLGFAINDLYVSRFAQTPSGLNLESATGTGTFAVDGNEVWDASHFAATNLGLLDSSNTWTNTNIFEANTTHKNGVRAYFGNNNDLSIRHDGGTGYILNETGNFILASLEAGTFVGLQVRNLVGLDAEIPVIARAGTAANTSYADLRFGDDTKLITTSGGVEISNTLDVLGAGNFGADVTLDDGSTTSPELKFHNTVYKAGIDLTGNDFRIVDRALNVSRFEIDMPTGNVSVTGKLLVGGQEAVQLDTQIKVGNATKDLWLSAITGRVFVDNGTTQSQVLHEGNTANIPRLGDIANPDNFLMLNRNNNSSSAAPLFVNQAGSGDIARFANAAAGNTAVSQFRVANDGGAVGLGHNFWSGNTDFNANTLHKDDIKAYFGTGANGTTLGMSVRHNGTTAYIENHKGDLYLWNQSNGNNTHLGVATDNGTDEFPVNAYAGATTGESYAQLCFGAAEKLVTDNNGISITGRIHATGHAQFDSGLYVGGGSANNLAIDLNNLYHQVASSDRIDKFRLWGNTDNYAIGMTNTLAYGDVASWSTTFTMAAADREGWIFRKSDGGVNDAAMSLSGRGIMTVKGKITGAYFATDAANTSGSTFSRTGSVNPVVYFQQGNASGTIAQFNYGDTTAGQGTRVMDIKSNEVYLARTLRVDATVDAQKVTVAPASGQAIIDINAIAGQWAYHNYESGTSVFHVGMNSVNSGANGAYSIRPAGSPTNATNFQQDGSVDFGGAVSSATGFYAPDINPSTLGAGVIPTSTNEINFRSSTTTLSLNYNRVGGLNAIDTFTFGNGTGFAGSTSGNIVCGTITSNGNVVAATAILERDPDPAEFADGTIVFVVTP